MRARLESIKTSQQQNRLVERLYTVSPKGSPRRAKNALQRDGLVTATKSVTPRRPQFVESIDH